MLCLQKLLFLTFSKKQSIFHCRYIKDLTSFSVSSKTVYMCGLRYTAVSWTIYSLKIVIFCSVDRKKCFKISEKLTASSFKVEACGFGGLELACWPLVPKFAGSHPAEAVGFLGRKILSTPSFGGEVKPSVPCRSFTARKRSLNVKWKSPFRQNYRTFLAHSSIFRLWVLSRGDTRGDVWWRKLERLTQIAQ